MRTLLCTTLSVPHLVSLLINSFLLSSSTSSSRPSTIVDEDRNDDEGAFEAVYELLSFTPFSNVHPILRPF
jgi:hypothetical protein